MTIGRRGTNLHERFESHNAHRTRKPTTRKNTQQNNSLLQRNLQPIQQRQRQRQQNQIRSDINPRIGESDGIATQTLPVLDCKVPVLLHRVAGEDCAEDGPGAVEG